MDTTTAKIGKSKYIYPAIFHVEADGISIEFPDFPGCLPCAHDMDKALKNAHEALRVHIKGMMQDGDDIPKPSPISQIKLEENESIFLIQGVVSDIDKDGTQCLGLDKNGNNAS